MKVSVRGVSVGCAIGKGVRSGRRDEGEEKDTDFEVNDKERERGGEEKKQTRVIIANRVIVLSCVTGVHNVFLSFMTFSKHTMAED